MLRSLTAKYSGGCMMLMRREGEDVHFLGTAFFVHKDGYLVTAAHNIKQQDSLVVVPAEGANEFTPMTLDRVSSIPVKVAQSSVERDITLLELKPEVEIGIPESLIGKPDEVPTGSTLMALGFSFGHYRLHNLISIHAVLSSKILSPNGTRLLLFDRMVHYGDAGGPLVNGEDERVIGVVLGRFNIMDFAQKEEGAPEIPAVDLSYAVSIEYAIDLMEEEGLDMG